MICNVSGSNPDGRGNDMLKLKEPVNRFGYQAKSGF